MKIFLETSIQIRRLLYTSEQKIQIRRQLAGKSLNTSMYVRFAQWLLREPLFMEFRRSILQIYAYVKSLLSILARDGRSEISLPDFIILLSEARGISKSPRAIQRTMLVLEDRGNGISLGNTYVTGYTKSTKIEGVSHVTL